jgi:NADH-quinone oxidoreductase subunit A
MSPAYFSSVSIVAYLALFVSVGVLFLFVNLLVGWLVRPSDPHPEKLEIYECGEPTIGSSFVQFDLRFYVVALLFIIFDVEVAFFFPWAIVFGKASHLADPSFAVVQTDANGTVELTSHARYLYQEMGVRHPSVLSTIPPSLQTAGDASADSRTQAEQIAKLGAKQLMWLTIVDIGIFFAVLLIGFAYVWKRGDLNWVRAIARERAELRSGGVRRGDLSEPARVLA